MKTKIVRIGNSQGVRIPKPLLEQAGLEGEVSLRVTDEGIVIEARGHPRAGWAEAAKRVRDREDDGLVDAWQATAFDDDEWEWE